MIESTRTAFLHLLIGREACAALLVADRAPLVRQALTSVAIAFVTVTGPHEAAGLAVLWFHVRLDTADTELPQTFPLSALIWGLVLTLPGAATTAGPVAGRSGW